MTIGWNDLQRIKRVEARANALGFEFANGDAGWASTDVFSSIHVKPAGDLLPIYSRNATFFSGSIESIESWLDGIEWARHYDEVLKLTNNKKRDTKEQQVRNQHLLATIKQGKLVQGQLGNYDEEVEEDLPF